VCVFSAIVSVTFVTSFLPMQNEFQTLTPTLRIDMFCTLSVVIFAVSHFTSDRVGGGELATL